MIKQYIVTGLLEISGYVIPLGTLINVEELKHKQYRFLPYGLILSDKELNDMCTSSIISLFNEESIKYIDRRFKNRIDVLYKVLNSNDY